MLVANTGDAGVAVLVDRLATPDWGGLVVRTAVDPDVPGRTEVEGHVTAADPAGTSSRCAR